MSSETIGRICRRLVMTRRIMVVHRESPQPAGRSCSRTAEILGEMGRFFSDVLLIDEMEGCARRVQAAGESAGDVPGMSARFLQERADLCLLIDVRCDTPEVAGAVVDAWRGGAALVEIGVLGSELAVLAKDCARGEPELMLDLIWDRFLCGAGKDHG